MARQEANLPCQKDMPLVGGSWQSTRSKVGGNDTLLTELPGQLIQLVGGSNLQNDITSVH